MQGLANVRGSEVVVGLVHAATAPVVAAHGAQLAAVPRVHLGAQLLPQPPHRLARLAQELGGSRTVVVDVVNVVRPDLATGFLQEIFASHGHVRELAGRVDLRASGLISCEDVQNGGSNLRVQLLGYEAFAKEHIDVILVRIGAIAANSIGVSAPDTQVQQCCFSSNLVQMFACSTASCKMHHLIDTSAETLSVSLSEQKERVLYVTL